MWHRSFYMSCSALLFCGLGLAASGPALAWDVAIGTNPLDIALYVGSGSGSAPTWTTIDERVRASDVPGPTVPNNWVTQTWDSGAGLWPAEFIEASEGTTQATIYNDDLDVEFWGSGEASVFGTVSNGDAVGSGIAYDFDLTLAPFTTANVVLDSLETYVYVESGPGDIGTAFAQAKLFQTDVGLNDPGGSNMPLAIDSYTLVAGDPIIDTQPAFSSPFTNFTSSPVTYHLRFEANVSVLEVPEPAMASATLLGSLFLIGIGRRRSER